MLPSSLSEETKAFLAKRKDVENIIRAAIQEIEDGSLETLEELIRKSVNKKPW